MIKKIKFLIAGALVGGGIGSKAGILFSKQLAPTDNFQSIEQGLAFGTLLGMLVVSFIIWSRYGSLISDNENYARSINKRGFNNNYKNAAI